MQNERKKLEELNLLDVYVESDGSAEIGCVRGCIYL